MNHVPGDGIRTLIDLDQVVVDAQNLPALPPSASRLAGLFAREDWDLEEVVDTVKLDPVLVGKILGAANSALSGSAVPITDVQQAVMRFGPGATLALALGSASRKELSTAAPGYSLRDGDLWRHSVAAAFTMERARGVVSRTPPPEAFATALLHDIGILVLARQVRVEEGELLRRAREEGAQGPTEAEMEILGVHHGEAGALVALHWGLPDMVVEAIRHHHSPASAPTEESRSLAEWVGLGHAVAQRVGAPGDPDPFGIVGGGGYAPLQVTAEGMDKLTERVSEDLDTVLARYE